MIKVGILVECGRDGLEVHVCRRLCQLLGVYLGLQLQLDIVPMDNKLRLLEECGTATRLLFNSGCERVVILWDERPPWPKLSEPLCWYHEREKILRELQQAGVAHKPVFLVCIERELESWLLFDERLLSKILSTEAHPVRIPNQRRPDRMPNPKGTMTTLFRKYGRKTYVDTLYARRFCHWSIRLKSVKEMFHVLPICRKTHWAHFVDKPVASWNFPKLCTCCSTGSAEIRRES